MNGQTHIYKSYTDSVSEIDALLNRFYFFQHCYLTVRKMSLQSFENDIRKASDEEKVALNDGKDGFLNSNDKFQNVEKMCLHALNSDSNPILTSRKHAKIGCNEVGSNETCLQSSESCEQSESIINVTIEQTRADDFDLEYGVEDNPPVHMCVLFGLQVSVNVFDSFTIFISEY